MKARSAVLFALSCFLCNCSLGLANAFSSFVVRDGDEGNDFDYGPRIPGNPIRKIASLTFDDTATLEGGGKRAEQKQLQVEATSSGRNLLQVGRGRRRTCGLPPSIRRRFYDGTDGIWTLNAQLLDEVESDVQRLLDCAASSETIVLARGITVNATTSVVIERPIRIVGEDSNGEEVPTWTCGVSEGNDQIAVIRSAENVILSDIRFIDCSSQLLSSPISVEDASVLVSRCRFESNRGHNGGAISARRSNLTLVESVFRDNHADNYGGGIFAYERSTIVARSCLFEENTSDDDGGGLRLLNETSAFLSNSSFLRNAGSNGGAIQTTNLDRFGELLLNGCDFDNNLADAFGGAISLVGTEAAISGSVFRNNSAIRGGAIGVLRSLPSEKMPFLEITDCSFLRNNASRTGGAVLLNNSAQVSVAAVSFINNTAPNGAAIALLSDTIATHTNANATHPDVSLTLRNGVCRANSAVIGGCLLAVNEVNVNIFDFEISANHASSRGGGVFAEQIDSLDLTNVSFDSNVAAVWGGGVYVLSSPVREPETTISSIGRCSVTIRQCSFSNNTSGSYGGGCSFNGYVSASVEDSVYAFNSAQSGGGIMLFGIEYEREDSYNTIYNVRVRGIDTKDILDRTRDSLGSPINPDRENLVPVLSLLVQNAVFDSNEAGDVGGALSMSDGCFASVRHSVFSENKSARICGGICFARSLFFCQYCTFVNNRADQSAGAAGMHGTLEFNVGGVGFCEGNFQHTTFVNNSVENHGGGIVVDGLEAYLISSENVTYQGNSARAGGAIASLNAAFVNVSGAAFIENKAVVAGGALSMSFLQFRNNAWEIRDVIFDRNSASRGGAIYAEFYVYAEDETDSRLFYDDTFRRPSIRINDTVLTGNSADEGGALLLSSVPTFLQNVSMERNIAEGRGGACAFTDGTVVLLMNGTFRRNEARTGGALMIDERSMIHCRNCKITRNRALEDGGGVAVMSIFARIQPIAFQCDRCSLTQNQARLGGMFIMNFDLSHQGVIGGLYLNHRSVLFEGRASRTAIVVLQAANLSDNNAEVGGGGIMASHPNYVVVLCSMHRTVRPMPVNITEGFLLREETHRLNRRLSDRVCPSWIRNSVGDGGYGAVRATFVQNVTMCELRDDDRCRPIENKLQSHQSASFVPSIKVTLVDQFGQRPAEPRPDHQGLLVRPVSDSIGIRLSGQRDTQFEDGEASITGTTVIGPPGAYTLRLNFSDRRIASRSLDTELRSCIVGEHSVLNGTACQQCEPGYFRVQEPTDTCEECPEHCVCNAWGIAPGSNHWLSSPCFTKAEECLSDNACAYDGREEALEEFFNEEEATCDLSGTSIERFRQIQCNEGHEGPLCGKCSSGYGNISLECRRCMSTILIIFLLLLNVAWFLVLFGIAVRGNIAMTDPTPVDDSDRGDRVAMTPERMSSLRSLSVVGGPARRCLSGGVDSVDSGSLSDSEVYGNAKRRLSERFKLLINFAQVNSMALAINTHWTNEAERFLGSLDFIGAVSPEAAITVDCLFSESSSLPRSLQRTILSLLLPFALLLVICILWIAKLKLDWKLLKRRLMLSLLIVLYISYIGLARRLFSILYCVHIHNGELMEKSTSQLYWSQDTSVVCYESSHAVLLGFLAMPLIIAALLVFPIGSAVFLLWARRCQRLDSDEIKETFGFMYQAYKKDYVFWDCAILLRKAVLALLVIFGASLGGNLQGLIAVCILGISFYLHITFLPFNDDYDALSSLNSGEKYSLIVSLVTFLSGVFLNDSSITWGGRVFFSIMVLIINSVFVLDSVKDIYLRSLHIFRLKLERDGVSVKDEIKNVKLVAMWVRHECSKLASLWSQKNDA